MTKTVSTHFGEPLSAESKKLVSEVKLKINQPIHPNFDNDFNVYRFIMASERIHKSRKDIVEAAAKTLNNHLRMRKALKLDTLDDIPFEKNPIFSRRLMPRGTIQNKTDNSNRLLWFMEYASINVEGIAHGMRGSDACLFQFWQFEHMLRRVNQQEEATGRLSSLRHVIDMNGYEINPFTMLFVSSGTLSYYSQLFHYENYPELVTPIDMVNIAKWIHVPYKLARTMMPAGFTERFRLHDGHYMEFLKQEMKEEDMPVTLGGKNAEIKCVPAIQLKPEDYWKPTEHKVIETLETIHISSRKSKHLRVTVEQPDSKLAWYFRTDGDVYFGVFYQPLEEVNEKEKDIDIDALEMVYPWFKIGARLVHEQGLVECCRPGKYYVVFSNKHSWIHRRTVDFHVQVSTEAGAKRVHYDGTLSPAEPLSLPS
uniref:CRAL-TRIO domain-containing protein n=1 Tax=Steinernema glaseri TaxID=37863 RepID=A0A1I8A580_9BILA